MNGIILVEVYLVIVGFSLSLWGIYGDDVMKKVKKDKNEKRRVKNIKIIEDNKLNFNRKSLNSKNGKNIA